MADSKKHHFVPQFLLKNFAVEGKDLLYVFDKNADRVYTSSVNNTGHENHFNSVDVAGEKFNFEDVFGGFEAVAAPIVKKLTEAENEFQLSIEEAYTLALFVCVQQIRTKLARTTVQHISNEILDWMKSDGRNFETSLQPISDEHSKIFTLAGFNDIEDRVPLLLRRAIVLFRAPADRPLWISDNPVVMYNEYPYGRLGLGTPGTNVYMPISKSVMLAFLCRIDADKVSRVVEIKTARHQPVDAEVKRLYHAIKHNVILDMHRDNVDFFNSLQIFFSSRFLYGPSGDFSMAEEMIAENPKLKATVTTVGAGHEKEYPAMPPGEHIVFHLSDDHFMIPVTLHLEEPPAHVVFTTSARQLILFNFFKEKTIISSIEVYKDRGMIRLMREVMIDKVEKVNSGIRVHIRHASEDLQAIMNQMKCRKADS